MDRRRAGFMLLEVLVALLVAALFLGVLARVLASAWQGNRQPMEQVSALSIARSVASESASDSEAFTSEGRIGRFAYATTVAPLAIEPRESLLAPAPGGLEAMEKRRAGNSGNTELQRMTIEVRAPSGRRLTFETIRLDKSK